MSRLKTHVTAGVLLRRAQAAGLFVTVVHKGDPDAGVLFVKVLDDRRAALWSQGYEGGWQARTEGFVPEAEVDALVAKERDFDRDLWVVEVEGREGAALLVD